MISISDDGEGMSKELLKRVFEVFVQADQPLDREQGGMGLGLPLVRMIANAHQGKVTGKSKGLGLGSEFELRLPLTQQRPELTNVPVQDNDYDFSNLELLLIEDNDGARKMMGMYLETEGFLVRTAGNGIEGVDSFRSSPANICIVDIGLPDLNGYDVARDIRSHSKQPDLLVALTGYGQEKDVSLAIEAGFDLHLTKPVDPEELVAIIGRKLQLAK